MAKQNVNSNQLELNLQPRIQPHQNLVARSAKELLCFLLDNELYVRVIPVKTLFRSSLIHEVVNRGDIFAMRVRDQALTIVPGTAAVQHVALSVDAADAVPVTKVS